MSLRKVFAALALAACAATAEAQVSRVFVSVNGNDANVCSNVATPCRTLAGGITQVDAQGEVIVIESGSYAGGTIAKSVKINVPAGIVAFSGLPIVVNPGAGGTVVLRGLTLKAATPGAGTGVTHQSGTLFVENTVVDGWANGLDSVMGADRLFVKGSVFRNQYGSGLVSQSGSVAAIDDSFFDNNGNVAVWFVGGTGRVSNTAMSHNYRGGNLWAAAEVTFERCKVSDNTYGLLSEGAGSILRVSQSTVTRNVNGLAVDATGTVESFGNNVVRGNISNDILGTITTLALK